MFFLTVRYIVRAQSSSIFHWLRFRFYIIRMCSGRLMLNDGNDESKDAVHAK